MLAVRDREIATTERIASTDGKSGSWQTPGVEDRERYRRPAAPPAKPWLLRTHLNSLSHYVIASGSVGAGPINLSHLTPGSRLLFGFPVPFFLGLDGDDGMRQELHPLPELLRAG